MKGWGENQFNVSEKNLYLNEVTKRYQITSGIQLQNSVFSCGFCRIYIETSKQEVDFYGFIPFQPRGKGLKWKLLCAELGFFSSYRRNGVIRNEGTNINECSLGRNVEG